MHQSNDGKKEVIHADWGHWPNMSTLISLVSPKT